MKLSIIIPTYNSASVLPKALDSIVGQTFTDWEVLIMDGASTDNTIEVAKSYNDPRIRIYSEPDKGIYDAMNKGIQKAKGEWLFFLGSDDYLLDNQVLEKIFSKIENNLDVLYGDVLSTHLTPEHHGVWGINKIKNKYNICHQAIFYNKALFKRKGQYDLKYPLLADFEFNMRWFFDNRTMHKYVPVPVAFFSDGGCGRQQKDTAFLHNFELLLLKYGQKKLNIDEKITFTKLCLINNKEGLFTQAFLKIRLLLYRIKRKLKKSRKQTNQFLEKYFEWQKALKQDKTQFVPFTTSPYVPQAGDPKIYAFYLTQFHAIPENDHAHGKGFTEWTNVANATPQFVGHHQPKIPYDLGFYNLLMPGVMERQVEIAKAYGVYGFCFYYYWFSGRKLLEKPLVYFLHSDIDFHYHLCWATENWSKKWDGGEQELIVEQHLENDDTEKFFNDLLPYISDPRYDRIEDKPVLIIYRSDIFDKDRLVSFLGRLNELSIEHGFAGLYIMGTNAFNFDSPEEYNYKGLVEFPPHGINLELYKVEKKRIPGSNFNIVDFSNYIRQKCYLAEKTYPVFKSCFPSWDNSPRKLYSNGYCCLMNDEDYHQWLRDIILWTREHHTTEENIIYVNAWNEWAEGAILEPTTFFGYKNLDILKKTIEEARQ